MPIEWKGIHVICGSIPNGGEGDTIAVGARRASCVDKLPGPGECDRTLGEGDNLVTVKHVKGLRRGRGRCTGRTRKVMSMDVARLERSRHGVHVGLGRGSTDVGEVGGEERRSQEAIMKCLAIGQEHCDEGEPAWRHGSTHVFEERKQRNNTERT
jgi:hypothetical protein